MGGKGPFKNRVGTRVSGLLRRLVVLALIGAAFAVSFATSAFAAEDFPLRPVIDSNHTVQIGRSIDRYRDTVVTKFNTAFYTLRTLVNPETARLEYSGDLAFTRSAIYGSVTARLESFLGPLTSPEYRSQRYRGWGYFWVLYKGYAWFYWQRL